jgi:hypothetical protein
MNIHDQTPICTEGIAQSIGTFLDEVISETGTSTLSATFSLGPERFDYVTGELRAHIDDPALEDDFEIGCLVKPLIALVSIILSERGELDLTAPVVRYIPELETDEKCHRISVSHLISQSTGYNGVTYVSYAPWQGDCSLLLQRVRAAEKIFDPGEVFNYEQSSTYLLMEILRRVRGCSWRLLARELLFTPLEMARGHRDSLPCRTGSGTQREMSRKEAQDVPVHQALRLSLDDLWHLSHTLAIPAGTEDVLQSPITASVRETIFTRTATLPRSPSALRKDLLPAGYGMGISMFANGFVGYDGSTANQAVAFRTHPGLGVCIALSVSRRAQALRRTIMAGIARRCAVPELPLTDTSTSELVSSDLSGHFIGNDRLAIDVEVRGAELTMEVVRGEDAKLLGRMHGRIDRHGALNFRAGAPGEEPSFFRHKQTGDMCLMLGMSTFKRVA